MRRKRIMLKLIFKKWDVEARTVFIWVGIGTDGRHMLM
jgi:hypothetical protein